MAKTKVICDRKKVYFGGAELSVGENEVDSDTPGFTSLVNRPFISRPERAKPGPKPKS